MTRRPHSGIRAVLRRVVRRVAVWGLVVVATWLGLCTIALVGLRWIDPPTTMVQMQRRVAAWSGEGTYSKAYAPVPLSRISDHLEHAVVAAEDTRFWQHGGIDWDAVGDAVEERARGKRLRGGSTITQQLAKNLFLTTHSVWLRKAAELPLTYLTEAILPKRRILELYLNVVEWGPGVYGAEAASRRYYGVPAARLSREQAASLAAVLPAPRRRVPENMDGYRDIILSRMTILGW